MLPNLRSGFAAQTVPAITMSSRQNAPSAPRQTPARRAGAPAGQRQQIENRMAQEVHAENPTSLLHTAATNMSPP
jgi:hypothetical protein